MAGGAGSDLQPPKATRGEEKTVKTGYLSHAFDLLNVEHLDLLARARSSCDRLVVGVLSDADVLDLTGQPPVVPFEERAAIVEHLRSADVVVPHDPAIEGGYDVLFVLPVAAPSRAHDAALEVQVLEPSRRTASPFLSRTLRPGCDEAVA